MKNESHPSFEDVILTGGTGRSGTTIVGKLLSRHRDVILAKPAEVKFITSGNGVLDLVADPLFSRTGKLLIGKNRNFNRFEKSLWEKWWDIAAKRGDRTGLHKGIDVTSLEELVSDLRIQLSENRSLAGASFIRQFVDYQLSSDQASIWVDTTPPNLLRASEISELMPKVRFIHMIRDGRDVACSVVREKWGPKEHYEALGWWKKRLMRILKETSRIEDQVHHVWLGDLVQSSRAETLNNLLTFARLSPDPNLLHYFEKEVTVENGNFYRWKKDVEFPDKFDRTYQDALKYLIDLGLPEPKRLI